MKSFKCIVACEKTKYRCSCCDLESFDFHEISKHEREGHAWKDKRKIEGINRDLDFFKFLTEKDAREQFDLEFSRESTEEQIKMKKIFRGMDQVGIISKTSSHRRKTMHAAATTGFSLFHTSKKPLKKTKKTSKKQKTSSQSLKNLKLNKIHNSVACL